MGEELSAITLMWAGNFTTPVLGGYRVPYTRTVQEEQHDERSRSPYGRDDLAVVGASAREARNGPAVIAPDDFVGLLWRRISYHSATGSQQKLAFPCPLW